MDDGSPAPGTLELEVTDFGPIARARVDLRPLTVFVGPSNTGKSYLAILIYALHRYFSGGPGFVVRRFRYAPPSFSPARRRHDLSDETLDAIMEMARSLVDSRDLRDREAIVLTSPVADALRLGFDKNVDVLVDEVNRCFGIGKADVLTRKGGKNGVRVVMRRGISNDSAPVEQALTLGSRGGTEFRTTIPAEKPIPFHAETYDLIDFYTNHLMSIEERVPAEDPQRWLAAWEFLELLGKRVVLPAAVGPLHLPAYYLPADRTGVMHAHSVVVSSLIASASTAGLHPGVRMPMLSGVLADFLEQLIDIDGFGPAQRKPEDFGTKIETALLAGEVRVERSTVSNYPQFTYRPKGWKDDLALANASSMVSELAPVVLYLRHMVGPGNVLIVEEPESHLHPAMQVEFIRQLAALVGAGIRVIITTHSEWLLEALANIVRCSEVSGPERDGIASGNVTLRSEQVGTWLFEPKQRPKGSVVKEIRLDDSGLYPSGYDDVAAALHNDWAEISSRIEAGP